MIMVKYALIALTAFVPSTIMGQPRFSGQVVDNNISIGYGLAIGDVDGDTKPDILLADKKQFVWYRNGDWKRFVLTENLTERDNVCIAARDIDGDGKVEVAVGAQWNPGETADTAKSGAVYYLVRPNDPEAKWTPVKLHHEPTTHRMRWVRVAKDKYHLIVLPLHGHGNKDGEGEPVKVIACEMPEDLRRKWKYITVDQSMHLTHNLDVVERDVNGESQEWLYIAGKEGIKVFKSEKGNWLPPDQVISGKPFGEVRASEVLAGISPMHGNELVVFDGNTEIVLTRELRQGHALAVGDLVPGGREEIVVGWREANSEGKVGVKIFIESEGPEPAWTGYWVDNNGMACEDLQVADLDGDGKSEIIAAGRATKNLKIYWNEN